MTISRTEVEALLPLPPATFHILLAIGDADRHGYAIIQAVSERTGGAVRLSAGTLYRTIQRLLEQGLLTELQQRAARLGADERRRYYKLTPLGRAVLRAEATRLDELVRMAREHGFAPAGA